MVGFCLCILVSPEGPRNLKFRTSSYENGEDVPFSCDIVGLSEGNSCGFCDDSPGTFLCPSIGILII